MADAPPSRPVECQFDSLVAPAWLACATAHFYHPGVLGWYRHWKARHRHPVSLLLHVVAIPMIPWAGMLALLQLWEGAWSLWWRPVGLLAASYLLQWIGHRVEGNDMGEWILIKRALGRPVVAVSPRYAESDTRDGSATPTGDRA